MHMLKFIIVAMPECPTKHRRAGTVLVIIIPVVLFIFSNYLIPFASASEIVQEEQSLVSQSKKEDLSRLSSEAFDIQGAGTHALWIVFKEIEGQFEKDTGIELQLWGSRSTAGEGCSAGAKMAGKGNPETEFGMMCCKPSEVDLRDYSLISYPLAWEPIMIVVHPSNPLDNLTDLQIRDIFSGKITNWKEVGGKDRPIGVVTRLHCSDRPGHWKRILPESELFAENRLDVKSRYDVVGTVSRYDNAIGHLGTTWITDEKLKILKVNWVLPDAEGLKSGEYPFKRLLNVVTRGKASGNVLRFIEYVSKTPSIIKYYKKYNLLKLTKQESGYIRASEKL